MLVGGENLGDEFLEDGIGSSALLAVEDMGLSESANEFGDVIDIARWDGGEVVDIDATAQSAAITDDGCEVVAFILGIAFCGVAIGS